MFGREWPKTSSGGERYHAANLLVGEATIPTDYFEEITKSSNFLTFMEAQEKDIIGVNGVNHAYVDKNTNPNGQPSNIDLYDKHYELSVVERHMNLQELINISNGWDNNTTIHLWRLKENLQYKVTFTTERLLFPVLIPKAA